MAHEYNISESGLELVKAYEGFRPVETVLVSGQKVIGYGHPYVRGESALLTQKKAEDILKSDLEPIEKIINHIVFAPISQNQFDALVSLAFNIGIDDFADCSVLHYLNNGQPLAAAAGFDEWRKSIIADQTYVIDALVRRRTAEKALFLSPEFGIVAAPRYEVPVLHDSTVNVDEDDIEVFSQSDAEGFVDHTPYEDQPAQDHRDEDDLAGALMLSERVAAPQIYEDTLDTNYVSETNIDAEIDTESDSIEDVVIDNVVAIKPEAEIEETIEVETETETEIEEELEQVEDLSPIALAAADVSERLDSLMEEPEADIEVEASVSEEIEAENPDLRSIIENEGAEETLEAEPEVVEFEASDAEVVETAGVPTVEPEILESTALEAEPMETEASNVEVETELEHPAPVAVKKEKVKGAGAFWTALVVGLLLIGGSLWKMKFSPATNMGEMGAFLAPVVLLVGAMMIMGGMFYMVKAKLRQSAV